mmetsp:Transcript_12675/g.18987  ORF Transcript_12675/g.18987 Transcript_12675/m.18987 type:complete len:655 (+) Transcript_12675:27-1991(+)
MLAVLILSSLLQGVRADMIYNAMYTDLQDAVPCVRLLTKDGQIGCSTGDGRERGVLRLFDESAPLLRAGIKEKIAPVIYNMQFNKSTIDTLKNLYDVAGIIVLESGDVPSSFSPDEKSPQSYIETARGRVLHDWNPYGSEDALKFGDYDFAIVLITTDVDKVLSLAKENEKNANDGKHISYMAEFNYPMYAKGNSFECLGDTTCLPVGGYSVFATMNQINTTSEHQKDIVLALAMADSSSFFHDEAPGASSYQSSVTTLLGAIAALSKLNHTEDSTCPDVTQLNKQIMVAFLEGEQFGYVGSRRLAKDLASNFHCLHKSNRYSYEGLCLQPYKLNDVFTKINLTDISQIIEIGQVGNIKNDTLFMHQARLREIDRFSTAELSEKFKEYAENSPKLELNVHNASDSLPGLPPSSIVSFLEEQDSETSVAAIHLSDHDTTFNNPYYLSRYDRNLTAESRKKLCAASKAVARVLYAAAGAGKNESCLSKLDSFVDCDLVESLFACLVLAENCDKIDGGRYISSKPVSHYTSVFLLVDPPRIIGMPRFLRDFLDTNLYDINKYGAVFHDSVDPVLTFNYASDKWELKQDEPWSSNLSEIPSRIYTESNWGFDISTRLYQREDPTVQLIMLVTGLFLTAATIGVNFAIEPYITRNFKTG